LNTSFGRILGILIPGQMPRKDAQARREYQREYHKKHYQKKKQEYIQKAKVYNKNQRKQNREYLYRVKRFLGCIDCGEINPVVLDFDHVRGDKEQNLSTMAHAAYSIKRMKEEIRKCEVRCSNCHRKKTHERRNT
jgi:hypothetical protein